LGTSDITLRHTELVSESPKHKETAGHSSTTLTNHTRNNMNVIRGIFRSNLLSSNHLY